MFSCQHFPDFNHHDVIKKIHAEFRGREEKFGLFGTVTITGPHPQHEDACERPAPRCRRRAVHRNIDGSCNNLKKPLWGSANIRMRRFLAADYGDNTSSPFTGASGRLPLARVVSTSFHPDEDIPSQVITNMVTQMGQFLDHDITLTPETELHDCCHHPHQPECFPLSVPSDDQFYSSLSPAKTCLEFTRSTAFCEEPTSTREQMNAITAFVDASNVYSAEEETSRLLRSFEAGRLKVKTSSEEELLPEVNGVLMAGDERALDMPGLASMHTLWLREHNRLAGQINSFRPGWTDERIFQAARRILIAEMQNIVYGEYLPVVLGKDAMRKYRVELPRFDFQWSRYDSSVDPSIHNSFATAAYRFGHSLIQGLIKMLSPTTLIEEDQFQLRDHFFNPEKYLEDGGRGMEKLIAGLINQPAQTLDRFVTREVTDFLYRDFQNGTSHGSDLVARNLQRGRDHGLPGYNKWRTFCGMEDIRSMRERPAEISESNWRKISGLYQSPDDIELFVAGLAETKVPGGLTGKTFNCIKENFFNILVL